MRIRGSVIAAAVFALAAGGWILSGQLGDAPAKPAGAPEAAPPAEDKVFRVRTRRVRAEPYASVLLVTGQTEASRRVTLRARAEGRVVALEAPEGAAAARGAVAVRLDPEDLEARIEEAEARIAQRELEFDAASKLAEKGFQARTRRAGARANLEAARAALERHRAALDKTVVRMPFDGVLNRRHVEVGDVLRKADRVAEAIDLDPILVAAFLSEADYRRARPGLRATARLADGTEAEGTISYVSAAAEPGTRTFRVELEIPNPDGALAAGVTAELSLPLPPVEAHRISAALFTLDGAGRLGVKTVDANDVVRFAPVEIVGGTEREVFVTGPPAEARVIVVGQDFVVAGQTVEPVDENEAESAGEGESGGGGDGGSGS